MSRRRSSLLIAIVVDRSATLHDLSYYAGLPRARVAYEFATGDPRSSTAGRRRGGRHRDLPRERLTDASTPRRRASIASNLAGPISETDPFWFVMNLGASEDDHEMAIEWVHANLVPAPGVLAIMAVSALVPRGRRRRTGSARTA